MSHHAPPAPPDAPPASRRQWLGLGTLLLPVFLASMDTSVLYLALPRITESLQPSAAQQLWILDIYPFLLAGLLITMGNLGDRWGRRRLMLCGAALFGAASIAAAFAPTAGTMIAARALMGVGGATLLPASLALIGNMFSGNRSRDRALAVGIWSAAFSFGMAVGPVIGGALLHHFWWGSVFLINVPVFVLLLVAGPALIPESPGRTSAPFDLLGVVLSMGSILPLVYALKTFASEGFSAATGIVAAVGAAVLVAFVRQQRRAEHPLLALDLFRNRMFTVAIVGTIAAMSTLGAMGYLTGIYLQSVLGYDVLKAALLGLPTAVVVAYFSLRAPWIESYLGRRWTFVASLLVAATGQLVLVALGTGGPVWVYVAGTVVAGAGYGVLFTFVSAVALDAAPADRAGQATAISEMSFELGTALGVAVLGSVATAVFTAGGRVDETLGETLGRSAADGDSSLASYAMGAWVDGIHVTVGVAALVLVAAAGAAWVALRRTV
ncbi:MFS transporter [Tsukamurella sp. 8F]|uniref:MFS transporter n=1 Tax=unclassified Tsukamurella TaxID=2633480 RepID=UPI0023B8B91C|nr:MULTISPECIES: MFS transporter [unclassified Tsukamurella]MDF0532079.1 MFS transporter [Tsukamurella sp. 8J]MDF0589191.1 MFS transporter [Tsukamurella sp. 8F]